MSTAQRFLLDIPDQWQQVDLSGEELARTRAQALASTEDPREKARINDMFRQGREVTRAARRYGALLGARSSTPPHAWRGSPGRHPRRSPRTPPCAGQPRQ
ncbi:hypothetical protein ABZ372_35330, partial [Streptomyces sp. NPDC005921]